MKNKYPVTFKNREVGIAVVEKEGLYNHIRIDCKLPSGSVERAFAYAGENKIPLGICMPRGDRFCVDKRIATSKFPAGDLQFIIGDIEKSFNCSQPWSEIHRIENARIVIKMEGKTVVIDQESSQQDSGQNP